MRLQHKFALYMFFAVILFLMAYSLLFYTYSREEAIESSLKSMQMSVREESDHLGDRLIEKSKIAIIMTLSDTLLHALDRSNAEFGKLDETERNTQIAELNNRWLKAKSADDPFVKTYLNNKLALLLKKKKQALPGEIGEIFLTNRYGALVGSTNKLSTLAHGHKYWWRAAHNHNQGKIFFDDRGYDESVGGYVIGIVIPVIVDNQVAGILKCNFNLLPTLSHYLDSLGGHNEHEVHGRHKASLVRSSGKVILGNESIPLSTQLPDHVLSKLTPDSPISLLDTIDGYGHIISASPVGITFSSDEYGFGGRYVMNGKQVGDDNIGWYLIITKDLDALLSPTIVHFDWVLKTSLVCAFLVGIIALLMGKKIAQPIENLTQRANRIGQGYIDEQIPVSSSDELGVLAESFNKMSSDLRFSREELVRKERLAALGQLTATVSHEIRNPLGAIQPALYVLKIKCDKDDERIQTAIAVAERNVERCDRIIDELLDFTRISELNRELVDIDDWLQGVIDEQVILEGVCLEKELMLNDLSLAIDTGRLRRAIINVVDNACHSMQDDNRQLKDHAVLGIKTRINGQRVEIIISDTGSGMKEDVLENIFKPLFSTKGFGIGLGMSAVRKIMEQHKGGIEVESKYGEGTTVTLWLPMANDIEPVS